jgi:hypothetical protein
MMAGQCTNNGREKMRQFGLGWLWVVALLAVVPRYAVAGGAEEEIAKIEKMRTQALLDGDVAALDRIYGDEWFYNNAAGEAVPKATFLERLGSGMIKVHALTTEAVQIRVYDGAAVVTGMQHTRATVRGEDRDLHVRYLHVYVQRGGAWRQVARQATNLPAPK